MDATKRSIEQAIAERESERCSCGHIKMSERVLCLACYFSLPDEMRRGFSTPNDQEYTDNYNAAIKYLNAGSGAASLKGGLSSRSGMGCPVKTGRRRPPPAT